MADDLHWSGAWRKLGPDDSLGMVSGVRVGMGSAKTPPAAGPAPAPRTAASERVELPRIESTQMEPPRQEPATRPNGRVKLPPA